MKPMRKVLLALIAGSTLLAAPCLRADDSTPAAPGLNLQNLVKPRDNVGLHYLRVSAPPVAPAAAPAKMEAKPETRDEKPDRMSLIESSIFALNKNTGNRHVTTAAGVIETGRQLKKALKVDVSAPAQPAVRKGPDDTTRLFKNVGDYNR